MSKEFFWFIISLLVMLAGDLSWKVMSFEPTVIMMLAGIIGLQIVTIVNR